MSSSIEAPLTWGERARIVAQVGTAMVAGVGAVVFVRAKTPPQEVIDLAREQELPLLSSTYSMFVSCGRLHACSLTGLDGRR